MCGLCVQHTFLDPTLEQMLKWLSNFLGMSVSSHDHPVHASNNQPSIFAKNKTKVEQSTLVR
jgi:hypothetical protein